MPAAALTVNGLQPTRVIGVRSAPTHGPYVTITLGSGRYHLQANRRTPTAPRGPLAATGLDASLPGLGLALLLAAGLFRRRTARRPAI
jgi:hypothetical protein